MQLLRSFLTEKSHIVNECKIYLKELITLSSFNQVLGAGHSLKMPLQFQVLHEP